MEFPTSFEVMSIDLGERSRDLVSRVNFLVDYVSNRLLNADTKASFFSNFKDWL